MIRILQITALGAVMLAMSAGGVAAEPASRAFVEFNVHNVARAKAFYGSAFGWSFTDYGPDYASFTTTDISGGFARTDSTAPGGPLFVFHASDLAQAETRVRAAGGIITRPAFSFPGGRRFHFRDLDGYEVAVWSER